MDGTVLAGSQIWPQERWMQRQRGESDYIEPDSLSPSTAWYPDLHRRGAQQLEEMNKGKMNSSQEPRYLYVRRPRTKITKGNKVIFLKESLTRVP